MFIAYTITLKATGEVKYIGATTTSLAQRWRGHKKHARRKSRSPLHEALASKGADAFTITHVASALDMASLSDLERTLIEQYKTLWPLGYNLTSGGRIGYFTTEEMKRRMRGPRGWKMTLEQREQNRLRHLGKKMSPEAIARTRAAHLGKIVSEETRRRQSEAAKRRAERELLAGTRKTMGPEARARLSALKKGVPRLPEVGIKISQTKRNKHKE